MMVFETLVLGFGLRIAVVELGVQGLNSVKIDHLQAPVQGHVPKVNLPHLRLK